MQFTANKQAIILQILHWRIDLFSNLTVDLQALCDKYWLSKKNIGETDIFIKFNIDYDERVH